MTNDVAYVVAIFVAIIFISEIIARVGRLTYPSGRFQSIDGLRGCLALLVFFHHAVIWRKFLTAGVWVSPESPVLYQFGEGSVAVFFMVTSFLFGAKILESNGRQDWLRLYISRALRLWPVYLVVIVAMLLEVGYLTNWTLQEPLRMLIVHVVKLVFFFKADVNGLANTDMLLAGVTWSLRYEWFFYFMLPIMSMMGGGAFRVWKFLLTAFALVFAWFAHIRLDLLVAFCGGFAALFLLRFGDQFQKKSDMVLSIGAILMFALSVLVPSRPGFSLTSLGFLAVGFSCIAAGATVFGLLNLRAIKMLGAASYGLYLIHGFFLHLVISVMVGRPQAASMSNAAYWGMVAGIGLISVGFSVLLHHLVEMPCMAATLKFLRRLRPSVVTLRGKA
ncbi:acyltransferase [Aquabacterium sp. NJ1]|uniref:acyltransferase family protein n=1 Tax=Aquabacterium sp. NJ1 TaxID=1538295 RepID=UPI00137888CA|nr:acyltransferase [Aquabacterium sp. NJ1]